MPLYATLHPRLYHKKCGNRVSKSYPGKLLFCKPCWEYIKKEDTFERPGEKIRGR